MQTRNLRTILTSAYLSAMLASTVAPIRSDATLAGAIDPMAAQQALQRAMSGLNAAGWMAPAAANPAVSQHSAMVPVNMALKAEPVMNEELMARLIKYTRNTRGTATVDARICKVLDLCDGSAGMPLKLAKSDSTDGSHFFGFPSQSDSRDIIILVRHDALEAYLTDKTGQLRAAAVLENGIARLITNEKAAEKFKSEMALFAEEALGLPPTGTSGAGNS